LLPLHDPLKPNVTEPPSGTDPLYGALAQLTTAPDCVQVAFHAWVTRWPAPNVQPAFQDDSAAPSQAILTCPVKPVFHWLVTLYVAVHPSPVGGSVVVPPRAWAIAAYAGFGV
jgi:hypothetical protein